MTETETSTEPKVVRILADGHGGDHGPAVVVAALAKVLAGEVRTPGDVELGIVGREADIVPLLEQCGIAGRVRFIAATEVVEMDESPSIALRRKKDSSIHVAARMVRDGEWDALVSAGNTGALMAISKLILRMLPGVDRPAIASVVPAVDGCTLLLDAGANVDCNSGHLLQFALMGSCYMQAAENIAKPRVGLLNIGTEEIKGTDVVKLTTGKLQNTSLNFIGNVEGTDIFTDRVDVVVCDGFVGNISLKTMEGTAKFLMHHLKAELTSGIMAKTGALLARNALKRLRDTINPSEYNGAPLLGLNGIVVKSHGSADAYACAIDVAHRQVASGMSQHIVEAMHAWVEG
ncbi:MAG: phosphate acyltransferase PlsX [Mariprofundaceae bacterium]|nr:phosphate acyltransferase PlsX [Mariprofundaceae bacterium]